MIIKLKNLSIPFHRLGLGAILINGNAPDIVADTLIGIIIDNHNEAKESSDA